MTSQEERILSSIIEALDRGEASMMDESDKGVPAVDFSSMNGSVSTTYYVPPLTEGKVLKWLDEAFDHVSRLEASERERVYKWVFNKVLDRMRKEGISYNVK